MRLAVSRFYQVFDIDTVFTHSLTRRDLAARASQLLKCESSQTLSVEKVVWMFISLDSRTKRSTEKVRRRLALELRGDGVVRLAFSPTSLSLPPSWTFG